jgi:hypothetical protein
LIKKIIKSKYGEKCGDDEILKSLTKIVSEKIDPMLIKPLKAASKEKKIRPLAPAEKIQIASSNEIEPINSGDLGLN